MAALAARIVTSAHVPSISRHDKARRPGAYRAEIHLFIREKLAILGGGALSCCQRRGFRSTICQDLSRGRARSDPFAARVSPALLLLAALFSASRASLSAVSCSRHFAYSPAPIAPDRGPREPTRRRGAARPEISRRGSFVGALSFSRHFRRGHFRRLLV